VDRESRNWTASTVEFPAKLQQEWGDLAAPETNYRLGYSRLQKAEHEPLPIDQEPDHVAVPFASAHRRSTLS